MSRPSMPPGFRFYPTDEELIVHYLRHRASSLPCPVSIIAEVDIYKFDPWDLPARAMFGDREWYFFSPRDRKYPNGARPNRAAASGYWKATGTDKMIVSSSGKEKLGVKKALVFYKGKPPKGQKTNWIMHEYRLAESLEKNKIRPSRVRDSSMRLDDWVLCRIYAKSSHLPSTTPVLDQEQESSIVEDLSSSTLANSAPPNALKPENKSFSFSDLLNDVDYSTLSQLLDMDPVNKSSITANINSSSSSNNNNNKWNSNTIQQLHQTESPVPGYSLSSQAYSPQCNLLLNHQFLIGSHLTFQ